MKSAFPGTNHLLRDSSIRNTLKPRTLPWLHPPGRGKGFPDHTGGSREPRRSSSHGPGGGLAEPRNHPHCSGSGDTKGVHPIYPLGLFSLGLWYPAGPPTPPHPTPGSLSSSISRGCTTLGPFPELLEKTGKCFLHRMKPPLCFRPFKCTFPRSSVSSLC